MRRFALYVFDLDGTLYRGNEPVPHAVEAVNRLAAEGALIRYATNNSAATRIGTAEKLRAMGYPARPEEVYGSAHAAARLLIGRGCRSVFVVGDPGLVVNLTEAGLTVVNAADVVVSPEAEGQADAVVVGVCRTFSYVLLDAALQQLLGGALFVATNRDPTYPIENGRIQPGSGSLVAAVAFCSGISPVVAGKPERFMLDAILEDCGVAACDTLVVGDREDTDIAFGKAGGCATAMVLTGVGGCESSADYVLPDLTTL